MYVAFALVGSEFIDPT